MQHENQLLKDGTGTGQYHAFYTRGAAAVPAPVGLVQCMERPLGASCKTHRTRLYRTRDAWSEGVHALYSVFDPPASCYNHSNQIHHVCVAGLRPGQQRCAS